MRIYRDRRVTPPKRVTSPTWGPPPPCKQALNVFKMSATVYGSDNCCRTTSGKLERLHMACCRLVREAAQRRLYSEAPSPHILIFLNPQIFLCGFKNFHVHRYRIPLEFARRHVSGFTWSSSANL